jgi:hypothetical protein
MRVSVVSSLHLQCEETRESEQATGLYSFIPSLSDCACRAAHSHNLYAEPVPVSQPMTVQKLFTYLGELQRNHRVMFT